MSLSSDSVVTPSDDSTIKHVLYTSINEPVADRIPPTACRILDIGCGTGALGQYLKRERGFSGSHIAGITYSEEESQFARENLDEVIVDDLNHFDSSGLGQFDCIICSHVLEHLYDPARLLRRLRGNLSANGVLIVALPNIMNIKQRMQFLRGRFRYEDWGLMDRTHYRFFDWQTARELLEDGGFVVTEKTATGGFPLMAFRRLISGKLAAQIDLAAARKWPNMYGLQFVFVARSIVESVPNTPVI